MSSADVLCERFGLGKAEGGLEPIARGAMGQVFSLSTTSGRWAVKQLFHWARADNAETDAMLQEAAARAGLAVALPRRAVDGAVTADIDGEVWRVSAWVDLAPPIPVPASTEVAAEVGAALATIHRLGLPPNGPVTPWLTNHPPDHHWPALAARARRLGADWAPALEAAIPLLVELGAIADDRPTDGDPVLTHCDFMPGNLAHDRDGRLVVLDWDHAGAQDPRTELGYVLTSWCVAPDGAVDDDAVLALAGAYGGHPTPDFSGIACANLNFTAGMCASALDATDEGQRSFALDRVGELLRHPLTGATIDRIITRLG